MTALSCEFKINYFYKRYTLFAYLFSFTLFFPFLLLKYIIENWTKNTEI